MRNSWPVAVFLPSLLLAQTNPNPSAQEKCVLSGRVTAANTGEPLSKATLHLFPQAQSSRERASRGADSYLAVSNADGSFQFLNIQAGKYSLMGEHAGFLMTQYGAGKAMETGTLLTLEPGQQLTNLTLVLRPQGVIAGRLVDEDGEPANVDAIQVLAQRWSDGKLTYLPRMAEQPDDRGQFRIGGLDSGKYLLCAEVRPGQSDEIPSGGKPAVGPVSTYFPSVTSIDAATPIEVHSGQELDGIEIRVRSMQTFHVRGKLGGTLPQGSDIENLQVSLIPEGSMDMWFGGPTRITKNGTFDIAGVGAGSYQLAVFSFQHGPSALARVPVVVGSVDVSNVIVNLLPPGTLHGKLRVEGAPASGAAQWSATNISVNLMSARGGDAFWVQAQGSAEADGSLTIENVSPGAYKLNVNNAPDGTYLKAIRFNGQDLTDRTIDLSQGVSGELEIVFAYGAAEVDGTIQFPEDSARSARVVLIADSATPSSRMRYAESDQNGTFNIKSLAPGFYHAYAFETLDPNLLENPVVANAIADRGVEVEVKESDKKQVQVALISQQEMRQILTRLGLGDQ
jgi:hypothetical protein